MFKFIGVLGAFALIYYMYQDQIPIETVYICVSILLAGYMAGGDD